MEETIGYEALFSPEEWDYARTCAVGGGRVSSHLCRCSRGNDMTCPADQPLEKLIRHLEWLGYKRWAHVVDARWASSLLAQCSNCGSRGGFDAIGFRKKTSIRCFWLCRTCSHWTEV